MLELDDIADIMADLVRDATAPLIAANDELRAENKSLADRLASVEAREIPDTAGLCSAEDAALLVADGIARAIADLPEPKDAEVDMEAVEAMLDAKLAVAVEALPTPEKGDPGEVDMEAVEVIVADKLAAAVAAIPPAEKGDAGEVDMEAVAVLIDKAVAALPPPKDGQSVDMAEVDRTIAERVKAAVEALPPPKDGIGLADILKDQDGCAVFVMSDGRTKNLGPIDGKDGKTFTLDDFDIVPLGDDRSFKFCFTNGEVMHSFEMSFPVMIFRGVYVEGREYARGDTVSWAGSTWHCDLDGTKNKPGEGNWTLSNKKGRDGKDAK